MGKVLNVILVVILVAGCSLLLYPTISDYSNKMHQTRSVVEYEDYVEEVDEETLEQALAEAQAYNEELFQAADKNVFFEEHKSEYESLLNVDGTNIMGYVDIPAINTTLPIYHGTEESVLQVAVGHLEWTSLPIGGENTHTVLSGHRGLPSARLFTDLDLMQEGDIFSVHVYNETLYYEVDQISVVLPEETSELVPEAGEDYCTLVTCTPYGVNTHRLLVRGRRTYPTLQVDDVNADVQAFSPIAVAGILAGLLWIVVLSLRRLRKRRIAKHEKKES